MSAVLGFVMAERELRVIPKFGMTLQEVEFAYGTADLVKKLRTIGALMPAGRHGRTLLFDVGAVGMVWAQFIRGDFDERLEGSAE